MQCYELQLSANFQSDPSRCSVGFSVPFNSSAFGFKRKEVTEEGRMVFVICILLQVLLGWSCQGERDGRDIRETRNAYKILVWNSERRE
jgi:hypothetical protein